MKKSKKFVLYSFNLLLIFSFIFLNSASYVSADASYSWAKNLGGAFYDTGSSISLDSSGNVYTTGSFNGTVDFDPSGAVSNLTSNGFADVFISKLNSSGNFVWAKSLGGAENDFGRSISLDSNGNVYTTGIFNGTADFDPSGAVYNLTSTGNNDIFISKLDSSGNFVWAKSLGGTGYDSGQSISIDSTGNVYTTGSFDDTVDFDPGVDTSNLTSTGNNDIFISKLDSSGNFVWAKSFGSTSGDIGNSISIDSNGNVYTTGYFAETPDFDPSGAVYNLTSNGFADVFISKLDSSGNFVWAKSLGGTSFDYGYSISIGSNGNVYTTGNFSGTADFDTGAGTSNLTSVGGADAFILKLSQAPLISEVIPVTTPTNDTTSNYTFTTNEAGSITYGGSCSSITTTATLGSNTITFNTLADGTYSNCTVRVTDTEGNLSNLLIVTSFTIDTTSPIITNVSSDKTNASYTTGEVIDIDVTFSEAVTSTGNVTVTLETGTTDRTCTFTVSNSTTGTCNYTVQSGDITSDLTVNTISGTIADQTSNAMSNFVPTTNLASNKVLVIDAVSPVISEVTLIPTPTTDTTPNYTFTTDEPGTITYGGSCSSATTTAVLGNNTITLNTLVDGTYSNCTVRVTDTLSNASSPLSISTFVIDTTPPSLTEVTPVGVVVNNGIISYTFNTNEAGTVTYGGGCSSTTTTATVGNNTITLNSLIPGNYNNCTITVTDALSNISNPLSISPFSIVVHSGGGSSTPSTPSTPVITTPVITTPTTPIQTPEPTNTNPVNNNTNQNQTTLGNNKLCTKELILTQNLKAGARDNRYHSYTKGIVKEVKILQAHMNRLNFNSGKVDGILGPITDGAIKRMQAYLGTTQDGLVGPITRDLINNSCN